MLPKAIRRALRWEAEMRLAVESTSEEVLLRPAPVSGGSRPQDVFGCLASDGLPKSLSELEAGVPAEARRRHARG